MDKKQLLKYVLLDVVASLLVWFAFYIYRRLTNDFVLADGKELSYIVPSYSLGVSAVAFPIVALICHYLSGAYITTAPRLRLTELGATIVSTFMTSIVIYFAMLVDDDVVSYRFYYQAFIILWGLFFVITYTFRAVQTWRALGFVSLEDIDISHKEYLVPMPAWQQAVKRAFDVLSSAFALVVLSPLFVYLAIRIKIDSKGPVFFKQERIGRNGEPFNILKFRTMIVDAETSEPMLTKVDDPRITKFGGMLRKYRLDELPQFANVLKGEMSIVGPRPERQYFIEQIEKVAPRYSELYRVRPGLFSWGPIKVGYSDSIEKMVCRLNYDLDYLNNMSLSTDIKILILSVSIIILGKGQ